MRVIRYSKRLLLPVLLLAIIALSFLVSSGSAGPKAPARWDEPVLVAAGAAHQGAWRMNRSDFRYVDDPSVSMNGDYAALAWVNQAEKDVFFQLYYPDSKPVFEAPVNVSRTPDVFSWLPVVVVEPSQGSAPSQVYVLWQEIVFSGGSHGGEIFFSRSTDGGKSFEAPLNLSNSIAGDGKGRSSRDSWENGSLDLIILPSGELVAAWTEYEGKLWVSHSSDSGVSFSSPAHVGGDNRRPARGPSLAADSEGAVYLAWALGEDPNAKIQLAKSKNGGRSFETPIEIGLNSRRADAPSLAVDSSGFLHVVYTQHTAGLFGSEHVRYIRFGKSSSLSDSKNDAPVKIPGSGVFSRSAYPSIVSGSSDRLYLLWEVFSIGSMRPRGLGFTVSLDGGKSFLDPQLVPGSGLREHGNNGGRQGWFLKKLAVNGTGGIAIVNSTFRTNTRSAVWLFRGKLMP